MDVKLFVDDEEIDLTEFVVKMLSRTLVGAVTSCPTEAITVEEE